MARWVAGLGLVASFVVSALPASAFADPGVCRVVDVQFTPGAITSQTDPQIVAWIEKADGTYQHTIFITATTGRYGMGNRPGRYDFNDGPKWPYGRRVTTFPVWADKHGLHFPEVDFQNTEDSDLSHPASQSSTESFYCRPMIMGDPGWDAMTCATPHVFTDKGTFSGGTSKYPPRSDVSQASADSSSVAQFKAMNPFDAVSAATPPANTAQTVTWAVPDDMPDGDYVLWVEASLVADMNDAYNATVFPPPSNIAFGSYGTPYRGQPSVVYKVPFTVSSAAGTSTASTAAYAGYGDPTGADGAIRPPDATIRTDTPGSGAQRLLLDPTGTYRVRVTDRTEIDPTAPAAPADLAAAPTARGTDLTFTAPGDDGTSGRVKGYDVRVAFGYDSITDDASFAAASPVMAQLDIVDGGLPQTIELSGLLPETQYTVAVRAIDDCDNLSPISTLDFTTSERQVGEVDACFIATAAYGSALANDVELLRRFRDRALERSTLGELFVESYYTFGPAVAGVVGESDLLRSTARTALGPLVRWVRRAGF